jgi:ubiquinone/menaquinone biosynthesis C-methylase UbiE
MSEEEKFVPALGFHGLTRFYDRVIRVTLKEQRFRTLLVDQTAIRPGHRVLDLGCGTANLTIMLKRACPEATIVGLDADAEALRIARAKAEAAGVDVEFREGMATAPPFDPGSFDRVVSSLLFHHLASPDKRATLSKVHELLGPGGELHLADWGKAQNALMRLAFLGVQLLDGFDSTSDNVRGLLVPMMQESGFASVAELHNEMTVFGTLSLYRAVRP